MSPAIDAVIREVFPAGVTLKAPDGDELYWRTAMLAVTRSRWEVYVALNGQIEVVAEGTYDPDGSVLTPVHYIRQDPLVLATDQGTLTASDAGGCGCTNPLKRFKPMPDLGRALA